MYFWQIRTLPVLWAISFLPWTFCRPEARCILLPATFRKALATDLGGATCRPSTQLWFTFTELHCEAESSCSSMACCPLGGGRLPENPEESSSARISIASTSRDLDRGFLKPNEGTTVPKEIFCSEHYLCSSHHPRFSLVSAGDHTSRKQGRLQFVAAVNSLSSTFLP